MSTRHMDVNGPLASGVPMGASHGIGYVLVCLRYSSWLHPALCCQQLCGGMKSNLLPAS